VLTLASGLLAGLIHVLTGPDHLAAIAPLAARHGRRGWIPGWTWGLGHASGIVFVAGLAVLLREQLPPIEVLSQWSERLVGAALIAVGLWALRCSVAIGARPHQHGAVAHDHVHVGRGPAWLRRLGHAHASFYLGVLHGVAGSSHFFGVLPALALPTRAAAAVFLGAFAVGTVCAMTAFASLIGRMGHLFEHRAFGHRILMASAAVVALVVGSLWIVA
jgi:hypothetical protein